MDNLTSLFSPTSIAVVGASRREGTLGKMFLDAVQEMNYKGEVYPINPKAESINGITCYPDVNALPIIPDLAIILLRGEIVIKAVEEVAVKGIRNLIVISAGFKETGIEGAQRESSLVDLVKKYNMRMIGPNSMGLFNTNQGVLLNATFSPTLPKSGHVGFVSQSGALGVAVLELSKDLNLGFSFFVSTGNKADVGDADCLRFLMDDDNTKSIILYQESIDRPTPFRKICAEIVKRKPILTLKSGRTSSGLKAASSHTGALASDDLITAAFLKQCGVIRCNSLNEMLESALAFESGKRLYGNRVAVVTNAGGPGILATDALIKNGLQLADLDAKTKQELRRILPAEASVLNPVDMIASANHDTYRDVCSLVAKDPNIDALVVIIVKPPVRTSPRRIAEELLPELTHCTKPVFFTLMAAKDAQAGIELFNQSRFPVYSSPESAARSLGNVYRYSGIKKRFSEYALNVLKNIPDGFPEYKNQKQAGLNLIYELLSTYQLKICPSILANEKDEILRFVENRNNVVLKIANESILHKSDLGLVKTGLSSETEVAEAYDDITKKARELLPKGTSPTILIQEMIPNGLEFILGTKSDPQFGKIIMFGLGGILVELYKDVVFRVLPIDKAEANLMIDELQGRKILEGFRNFPVIDKRIIAESIIRFSRMINEHPEIIEMDLNPLIWSVEENDMIVVDSRCTVTI